MKNPRFLYGGGEFLWAKNGLNDIQLARPSRPVEFGVIGVVVLGVDLVLRDTQGVADFAVSNRFFIWRILLRETFKESNIFA